MKRALLVVDVQKDFCEGGALAAADTLSLLGPLGVFVAAARGAGVQIVFTQDWHPPNHSSFRPEGGSWPVHCVAGSSGAQLMPPLAVNAGDLVVHKGEIVAREGYSAFDCTGLGEQLAALGIQEVAACGVATEYCVRATAIDAIRAGFRVAVLTNVIRPVKVSAVEETLREMSALGIDLREAYPWLRA